MEATAYETRRFMQAIRHVLVVHQGDMSKLPVGISRDNVTRRLYSIVFRSIRQATPYLYSRGDSLICRSAPLKTAEEQLAANVVSTQYDFRHDPAGLTDAQSRLLQLLANDDFVRSLFREIIPPLTKTLQLVLADPEFLRLSVISVTWSQTLDDFVRVHDRDLTIQILAEAEREFVRRLHARLPPIALPSSPGL